uniref:Uncharacterized protein n=1 Tax=Cannabis sativa TaxID=3483 RepID=A0A803PA87_CANSA
MRDLLSAFQLPVFRLGGRAFDGEVDRGGKRLSPDTRFEEEALPIEARQIIFCEHRKDESRELSRTGSIDIEIASPREIDPIRPERPATSKRNPGEASRYKIAVRRFVYKLAVSENTGDSRAWEVFKENPIHKNRRERQQKRIDQRLSRANFSTNL